ncbi:hypothetical protein [Actinoplanes sp. G11-F43]
MTYYRSAHATGIPEPPPSNWQRWGAQLYQGTIAAGAIAAAITAVT